MLCGVIIVSILEGRHLINKVPESDMQTVKITFEKLVDDKNLGTFNKTTLDRDDIKNILKELLAEEVKEETEDKTEIPKNEFTEKDE